MRILSILLPRLLAIVAAVALCCSPLLAQQTLGGITGEVTDASGGVIPNATVTVVDEQTSLTRTTKTNGTGSYTFVNLPIGTYTLTYTADGLRCAEDAAHHGAGRSHGHGERRAQGWPDHNTVEVEASPLMNAVDTTNGYVLDKTQIEAVPLPTGSFTGLATQSTGRERRACAAARAPTPAWATRPSGPTASATPRTASC